MKHKLIKTENYLLVVDDSVHPYDSSKVGNPLAHLPLNGSPILEGVDLLPPYSINQYPTEFECEMEIIGITDDGINTIQEIKTITTAKGVQWVGKYK